MSKSEKKVSASVSNDCWKSLKVLAVQREVSLQQVVQDILERYSSKKKVVVDSEDV